MELSKKRRTTRRNVPIKERRYPKVGAAEIGETTAICRTNADQHSSRSLPSQGFPAAAAIIDTGRADLIDKIPGLTESESDRVVRAALDGNETGGCSSTGIQMGFALSSRFPHNHLTREWQRRAKPRSTDEWGERRGVGMRESAP